MPEAQTAVAADSDAARGMELRDQESVQERVRRQLRSTTGVRRSLDVPIRADHCHSLVRTCEDRSQSSEADGVGLSLDSWTCQTTKTRTLVLNKHHVGASTQPP